MPKAFFLAAITLFAILYIKYHFKKDRRFLISIFIAALAIRIACATAIFFFNSDYGGFFSGDESVYYKKAVNVSVAKSIYSKNIFQDTLELNSPRFGTNLFSILESILIFTFGPSLLLIRYFNSFLGALLPVIIFLLAKTIFDNQNIAKTAAVLSAFLPSLVVWSSTGLKETLIILMIASFFYYQIKNQERFSFFYFTGILLSAAAVFYLQTNAALILILLYGLWFIFTGLSKLINKQILVLLFIIIGSYIFFTNQRIVSNALYEIVEHQNMQYRAGDEKSTRYQLYPYLEVRKYFLDYYKHLALSKEAYHMDEVSAEALKNSVVGIRWPSFFISYSKGLIYLLFAPFLWSINSLSQLMVYPQVVLWWGIIPCIVYGMVWSLRYKRGKTLLIILFVVTIYSVLALTEGNVGSVFRHKDWVTPLCIMFAAVGINKLLWLS